MAEGKKERGSVMMEFGICLPFLLSTLFMMIDLGLALEQYSRVTRIIYEGARYGSGIAALENSVDNMPADDADARGFYANLTAASSHFQHYTMQQRILNLFTMNGLSTSGLVIRTRYSHPAADGRVPDVLTVQVLTNYSPLSPFFSSMPINVEVSGAYLNRDRS